MTDKHTQLLEFWFGDCRERPGNIGSKMQLWFGSTSDDDRELKARFESLYLQAVAGDLRDWQQTPSGRLALILLLDQLPRCLFRGTPEAFASDYQAASLCLAGINQCVDIRLHAIERVFFYMPLQHVEDSVAQDAGVTAYRRLEDEQTEYRETYKGFREYADLHRDIIARFGRFPHRNAILGRQNTAEEAAYLAADAPTFA